MWQELLSKGEKNQQQTDVSFFPCSFRSDISFKYQRFRRNTHYHLSFIHYIIIFLKIFCGLFVPLLGQDSWRVDRKQGREGEWHAAKGHWWNRTCVRCSEDIASVYGAPALPTGPRGALITLNLLCFFGPLYFFPLWSLMRSPSSLHFSPLATSVHRQRGFRFYIVDGQLSTFITTDDHLKEHN